MTRRIGVAGCLSPTRRCRSLILVWFLVSVAALTCASTTQAQDVLPADAELPADRPTQRAADSSDPTVPAGAVRSYLDACREGDYEAAAEREQALGAKYARQLKIVLDRKLWIQHELLSN